MKTFAIMTIIAIQPASIIIGSAWSGDRLTG
jgi:hypothetical protein